MPPKKKNNKKKTPLDGVRADNIWGMELDKSTPNPNGGKKPTLPPLRKAAEDRGINIYKKGKLKKKPELIAEMMPILDVEVDERKVKADDKQKQRAATEKKKEEEEAEDAPVAASTKNAKNAPVAASTNNDGLVAVALGGILDSLDAGRKRDEELSKQSNELHASSMQTSRLLQKQIDNNTHNIGQLTQRQNALESTENEHYNELTRSMKKQQRAMNRAGIRMSNSPLPGSKETGEDDDDHKLLGSPTLGQQQQQQQKQCLFPDADDHPSAKSEEESDVNVEELNGKKEAATPKTPAKSVKFAASSSSSRQSTVSFAVGSEEEEAVSADRKQPSSKPAPQDVNKVADSSTGTSMLGDVPSSNYKYETPSKGGAPAKKQPDTKLTSAVDKKPAATESTKSVNVENVEELNAQKEIATPKTPVKSAIKFAAPSSPEVDNVGAVSKEEEVQDAATPLSSPPVAASVESADRKQSSSKTAPQAVKVAESSTGAFNTKLTPSDDKKPTSGGRIGSSGFSFEGASTATGDFSAESKSDTKPAGTSGGFSFGGSTSTDIESSGFTIGVSAAKTADSSPISNEEPKQQRSTKKYSTKSTDRRSVKSTNGNNRKSRRTTTRAQDQKKTRKQLHKKNRNEDSAKTDVHSKIKVDKNLEDKKKSSREEVVDYSEVDAVVLRGDYKDFQGMRVTDEADASTIKVKLLINSRNTVMKVPKVIDVKAVDVGEPDSDDMIASIDILGDETEDNDLIKHENETWECPKCHQENKNDAGYCANIIDDKLCGGTKKAEKILDWSGCFGPTTKMWKCDACFVKNEESADVCAACEKKRP